MSHAVFLVLSGLVLIGVLSAVLEQLGIRNHYWAVFLAAVCVVGTAWAHSWKQLLIAIGVALLYLGLRRDWEMRAKRKASA